MNPSDEFTDLFAFFKQYVQFTESEKNGFASLLTTRTFNKGETITEIGAVEQHLSFISSGIIRSYCLKGSDDTTLSIEFSNCFISAYTSYTERTPSQVGLEALTQVKLYQMRYENLNQLYSVSKEGERMGRLAAEGMFRISERRLIDLLTKTAAERYHDLLQNEPHLLLTIPQKYIAEYLGIQPESLSRLKKQLMP